MSRIIQTPFTEETADSFLTDTGLTETKLLSLTPLKKLPAGAWRLLWDALNLARMKLVAHRLESLATQEENDNLLRLTDHWYLSNVNGSKFTLVYLKSGYSLASLGSYLVVHDMLQDLNFESWKAWHTLCIVDHVIRAEQEQERYQAPRKVRMSNATAYRRIEGWVTYEALKR